MSSSNFGVQVKINLRGMDKFKAAVRQGVFDYGEAVLMPEAKEKSPVKHVINRESIEFVMQADEIGKIHGQLQTGSGYGGWLEIGTGLHGPKKSRVVPVKANFLSWIDEESGERIFAKSTEGMAAQPYMLPALVATKSQLKTCVLDAVHRAK